MESNRFLELWEDAEKALEAARKDKNSREAAAVNWADLRVVFVGFGTYDFDNPGPHVAIVSISEANDWRLERFVERQLRPKWKNVMITTEW